MSNYKECIDYVLEGKATEHPIDFTPIDEIDLYLQTKGFNELETTGDELNGWSVDFWYIFIHPNLGKFGLSGSLFYGDMEFKKIKYGDI